MKKWIFLALIALTILVSASAFKQEMNFVVAQPENKFVNNDSGMDDAFTSNIPTRCTFCHTPKQLEEHSINSTTDLPQRYFYGHFFLEGMSLFMSAVSAVVIIYGFLKVLEAFIKPFKVAVMVAVMVFIILAAAMAAFMTLSMAASIAAVLVLAAFMTAFVVLKALIKEKSEYTTRGNYLRGVRNDLGGWILLGLLILIAAEILSTIVIPSWDKLGILAATVAIRLVMGYVLEKK